MGITKYKIGQIIYYADNYSIYQHKIGFLGKKSFIVENYDAFEYGYEIDFDDENIFYTLSEAKNKIKEKIHKDFEDYGKITFEKFSDIYGDWWEVR